MYTFFFSSFNQTVINKVIKNQSFSSYAKSSYYNSPCLLGKLPLGRGGGRNWRSIWQPEKLTTQTNL